MNAALLMLLMHPLAVGQVEADESVAAGREALSHWWPRDYPWYDSETDGVRRVEIPKPRDWTWLREWIRSLWPDWDLSWLWNWWPNWSWRSLFSWPVTFWQWATRVGLVLLLALLVYLTVRAWRKWRGEWEESEAGGGKSGGQEGDAQRIEALPFPVSRGRLDLLAEARVHYLNGDYGQAIVYLFSYQLLRLDRQQIIRLTKGKTNRQYLREVGPRRALGRMVEQTMVAFEDVFFGNRSLDRARFESCWSRLDEFESLAAEGAG